MIELMLGGAVAVLILVIGASDRRRTRRRRSELQMGEYGHSGQLRQPTHPSRHGGNVSSGRALPTRPEYANQHRHPDGSLRDYPFHWVVK